MEDSRTVFVAGLPKDVKERELNLLFRDQPGFLAVTLRVDPMGRPLGFATFVDNTSASDAITALNDTVLDPSSRERLRLELAKQPSRTFMKRTRDGDAEVPPPKLSQFAKAPSFSHEVYSQVPTGLFGASPSTTLFISGLGPQTSAAYMSEICAAFPGFDRLKVDHEGENNACCFARFRTLVDAQTALQQLQGCALPTSATLRCEFARSDLGRKAGYAVEPMPALLLPTNQSYPTPTSSTLFISGLGESINTADMQRLCQAFPGFQRLKVDHEGHRNACCFVLFQSPADASYAMQHLAGYETVSSLDGRPVTLRCEFAKSDLGAKALPDAAPPTPVHYHLDPYSYQRMVPQLFTPVATGSRGFPKVPLSPAGAGSSTLFISGLGPDTTEEEFKAFCTFLPGFDRLKVDHEGQPKACAFARFLDYNYAVAAFTKLLQHPFRGKMLKVEFAKQDLGRKASYN